jgi:hypothetical protein
MSSLALTFPITHRAGLPTTPPSIDLTARSTRCGPTGAGCFSGQSIIADEYTKPHSRLSGVYDAGMQGSFRLDLRRVIHHEGLQGFYPALALRRGFFM